MDSQQYDAAIDHYSAAVSLQPQKPDALVKRSRARAAKRLWDDALQDTDEVCVLVLPWDSPDNCPIGNKIRTLHPSGL